MPSSSHWTCPECGKVRLTRNLYSHLKVVHRKLAEEVERIREQIHRESGVAQVTCPLYSETLYHHAGLSQHCLTNHSEDGAGGRPQDYSLFSLSFSSREEFEQWFAETCEKTCTSFYKDHRSASASSTKQKFVCNRAGAQSATATQRAALSRKDVRHCSCHLLVHFNNDGTVYTKGCLGHVGHELDPALLRFSESQRLYLKSLLEEHSMDYIIGRPRKDDPTSSKLSFVVQDLHNIVTRYNMAPGWRHNDDLTSIQIRFEENNLDDGIRCLQLPEDPSGKGLLLVIITPLMLEWLKKYSTKSVSLDDTVSYD